MTTLDDAAERRCREIAIELMKKRKWDTAFPDAIRATWKEATEAAALKCDAEQIERRHMTDDADHRYNNACQDCAAAIRGKGR